MITLVAILLNTLSLNQFVTDTIGIDMVDVKAGSFLMGSNGNGIHSDESPAHKVSITYDFKISSTEITNAQYELFDPNHRSLRGKNGLSKEDNEAVIYVSYDEASAFCRWMSEKTGKEYRLPTEAEWEYACRAGTMGPYGIGDRVLPKAIQKKQVHTQKPEKVSLTVKNGIPNAWGIYDMHGNVEEWCMDFYGQYSASDATNPAGPVSGLTRVVRGGSHSTPMEYLRSSNRSALIPDDRTLFTGFRVVEVPNDCNLQYVDNKEAVSQYKFKPSVWKTKTGPMFLEPINFVTHEADKSIVGMFSHNHCPSVTWLPNGDILAIWFSTEDENGREMTILQSRLKKGAKEWTKPELFYKVADRNMTGSALFYDEDTKLLYHFNGVEAAGTWRNLSLIMRTSGDCGYTWSEPRFVNPEHEPGNQVITGTLKLKNGNLIQPCDATPTVRGGTIVHISSDNGKTWERSDKGKEEILPRYVNGASGHRMAGIHACVVELSDGRLLAFGRDNNIVLDGKSYMPQSISEDGGYTWTYSPSCFPPISSGQRAVMTRLKEGPILLVSFTDARIDHKSIQGKVFTDRSQEYVGYGMYASLSYDDGKTWTQGKLITDGKERYLYGGAFTGYFMMDSTHAEPKGYLAMTQSPDGVIHLLSSAIHYRFNLEWLTK